MSKKKKKPAPVAAQAELGVDDQNGSETASAEGTRPEDASNERPETAGGASEFYTEIGPAVPREEHGHEFHEFYEEIGHKAKDKETTTMKTDNMNVNGKDILDLLNPARRAEILQEALGGVVEELYRSNPDATVDDFFGALEQHEYGEALGQLSLRAIFALRTETPAAPVSRDDGPRTRRARTNSSVIEEASKALIEHLHAVPSAPRVEEIYSALNLEPAVVKRALAKLKEAGKVVTVGQRRSTTYRLAEGVAAA